MSKANVVTYGDAETLMTGLSNAIKTGDAAGRTLLKDTVGWTGKNLLKITATSKESNGITFTVNADQSITVNGTATAEARLDLYTNVDRDLLVGKDIILSGCPDTGSQSTYWLYANLHNVSDGSYAKGVNCYTMDGTEYQIENTRYLSSVVIKIANGYTANNLTFYPMLRYADIADSTYEPYHESVETMYEEGIHGVNLLSYDLAIAKAKNTAGTWNNNVYTLNNVTFTFNNDNSITVNTGTGGASAETTFQCLNKRVKLKTGAAYISSGVPVGASFTTYDLARNLATDESGTGIVGMATTGDLTFTVTDKAYYLEWIRIRSGATVTNVVYKPMLRKADIEDSTYRPYNYQSIQHQLNNQTGVLGAKNLLHRKTGSESGTSHDISYVVNADNSITVNGTANGRAEIAIDARSNVSNPNILPNGKYIGSGCPAGGSDSTYMLFFDTNKSDGNLDRMVTDIGNGGEFTINYNGDTTNPSNRMQVIIRIEDGVTVSNLTFKPMIRLASDPDDTYQPYAMTNRELTENLTPDLNAVDMTQYIGDSTITAQEYFRAYKITSHLIVIDFGGIKATTAGQKTLLSNLPFKWRERVVVSLSQTQGAATNYPLHFFTGQPGSRTAYYFQGEADVPLWGQAVALVDWD